MEQLQKIGIIGITKGEERKIEKKLLKLMAQTFPKLMTDTQLQIQKPL